MRVAKGKRVTAHDVRQLERFRHELGLLARLEREGVPHAVAVLRVFATEPIGPMHGPHPAWPTWCECEEWGQPVAVPCAAGRCPTVRSSYCVGCGHRLVAATANAGIDAGMLGCPYCGLPAVAQ